MCYCSYYQVFDDDASDPLSVFEEKSVKSIAGENKPGAIVTVRNGFDALWENIKVSISIWYKFNNSSQKIDIHLKHQKVFFGL